MITIADNAACCGCHACAMVCPKNCIHMVPDEEGFLYPRVDIDQCVACSLCEQVCPMKNPDNGKVQVPEAYAAVNRSDEIRRQSSSGGVFSILAEYVVGNGGVVFGAAFDAAFRVGHVPVTDKAGIAGLRGSKYVQSEIGDTYRLAKEQLETGRLVYFSGTPCQISGLLKYLKKDYSNLITQDIVCHGVPSPGVWKKYTDFQKNRFSSSIKAISFRTKKQGCNGYFVTIKFENDQVYEVPAYEDAYIKAFTGNYCLRPSCYSCKHKGQNRISDITLADYWGIEHIHPDMDDRKGVSLVWVNSEKGKDVFSKLADKLDFCVSDLESAIKYNSCAVQSVAKPHEREVFMKTIDMVNFYDIVASCCKLSLFARAKGKVKQLLRTMRKR